MPTFGLPRITAVEALTFTLLACLLWVGWDLVFWNASSAGGDPFEPVEGFLYDPEGSGGQVLGLGASGWLIWRRRQSFADATRHVCGRWIAVLPLCLALAIRGWAEYAGAIDLQIPALALLIQGGAASLAGRRGMRIMLMPCVVLLSTMPIPVAVLNWLLYPMQLMTAKGASFALDLLGIPFLLTGEQVHARGHSFYVIEGCAGLRSLQTLLLATLVYCDLMFRTRAQVLLLTFAVFPVGIVVNQARVLSIVLNPASDLSADHTMQGLLMICIGVVTIGALDALIQLFEPGRTVSSEDQDSSRTIPDDAVGGSGGQKFRFLAWTILFASVGTMAIVPGWISPWSPAEKLVLRLAAGVPTAIGDWRAVRTLELDREFLGSVRWSDWLYRRYRAGSSEFELMILEDDHDHRHHDVVSGKTLVARPGQVVELVQPVDVGSASNQATRARLRGLDRRTAVVHWRLGERGRIEEFFRSALALDQSLFHRDQTTLVVRLEAELSGDVEEDREQEAMLVEVARTISRALAESGLVTAGAFSPVHAGSELEAHPIRGH